MDQPLDELYLTWLYKQIGSVNVTSPGRTYWNLMRVLFKKEFVWLVPNDDNRVEDGRDIRQEFLSEKGIEDADPEWLGLGCSMLEMLMGVSRRLAFEAEGQPRTWFWHLLDNLELSQYTDKNSGQVAVIEEVIDRVIWRTYEANGRGGLFPLNTPDQDQREVEIWYQLCAYLLGSD